MTAELVATEGCPPEHHLYGAVLERIAALVAVGDDLAIRYLSGSVRDKLGWGPYGPPPRVLATGLVHADDREAVDRAFAQAATTHAPVTAQVRVQHADGSYVTLECVAKDCRDDERINGFLLEAWDVTARDAAYRQAALYDVLTGLPNRLLFDDRLRRALGAQQRRTTRVGVVFVDLDDFKRINDVHGHAAGDAALREVARRLTRTLRPGDTAARYGGDEFIVLCEELDDTGSADAVAKRIHDAFAEPIHFREDTIHVRASIGVALAYDPLIPPDRLVSQADESMYEAKRRARDTRPAS